VTVIVATYNRSNILGYAIRSVLAQTRADWELLVIGDGCTDDTAEVVASFADPRIRFINLDPRVGDQSGPTNEGIARARGRWIALLNHDDFWFPDHLAETLAVLERTNADCTFSLQLEADPDGRWRINATYPDGAWDPIVHPNASTWVFRRDLGARVGRLRHRDRLFSYPTRDWLWRARKARARFTATRAVTVVVISATTRRNVYAERQWREHDAVWRAMVADPGFRERRLVDAWLHPEPTHLRIFRPRVLLRALAMRGIGRAALALGFDPETVYCYHKFPKRWGVIPLRGAVIRELYRRRGLDAAAVSAVSSTDAMADTLGADTRIHPRR
jgi:glycosyltransferase involved in cell wall biosynthesis